MRLMRQPCHLRLRLLIGKVLNTGKIILAEWANFAWTPFFLSCNGLDWKKYGESAFVPCTEAMHGRKNMESAFPAYI